MPHPAGRVLLAVLVGITLSCTSITPTARLGEEGAIGLDSLAVPNAVPLAWGRLAAVTYEPEGINATFLWFEDGEGVIRRVGYKDGATQLWEGVLVIRRQ